MPSDGDTLPRRVETEAPSLGEADPSIANLEDVYLDSTLVLVGCGQDKRDPESEADLHKAVVGPDEHLHGGAAGPTGPAWRAANLYTSSYFSVKREFAKTVTAWTRSRDAPGWGILSAEHGVLQPFTPVKYYDTSIDDLGADPTNEDHWATHPYRRPDGAEVVTEMDAWATDVAISLSRWLSSFRERGAVPWESDANTLLVLAGQDYVEPLRERKVFENGIARVTGDPNHGFKPPVNTRFLFEEIDQSGIHDQMAWLSDAVDRLDEETPGDPGDQRELGTWVGPERTCADCGTPASETPLEEYDGTVYCSEHAPIGRCGRCATWTHETGLGAYPLCPDCQTDRGGREREPLTEPESHDQSTLDTENTDAN